MVTYFEVAKNVLFMKKTLIIYSTTDGQTKRICDKLIDFSDRESNITLCSIENASETALDQYSKVVIGASIRYGKHNQLVYEFIRVNREELEKKQTAFFTVNVVARKPAKNTPLTNPYVIKFLKKISWKPTKVAVFAGRVDYPSYKLVDKYMIRFIMWLTNGPTDVSKSYEFTNWNEVSKFGKAIKEM